MLLLPITTQCFPAISILLRFNSWIIPAGVQETNPFSQPQVHRHSADENHRHLLRINCLDHMVFADMFREWKLAQNSMNIWIVIQFLNQCKQFLFRGFFRKFIRKRLYSNICTGFLFISDIYAGCRICAHLNDSKCTFFPCAAYAATSVFNSSLISAEIFFPSMIFAMSLSP